MSAVIHRQQRQERIIPQCRVIVDPEWDQRVVFRHDEQRWYADPFQKLVGRLGTKIVSRVPEPEQTGGVVVVEILDTADFGQVFQSIDVGRQAILTSDAIF